MKKLILILLLLPSLAWGIGYSTIGDTSNITITRTAGAMDSAWAVFYLNTAVTDSFKAIPIAGTSHKTCYDSTIVLANAGTYRVRMYLFSGDALVDSLWDTWHNESALSTPDDWTQNDSAVFYGLVWSDAVDTAKAVDTVITGVGVGSMSPNVIDQSQIANDAFTSAKFEDAFFVAVADTVWEELAADHTTDATMGDSLITLTKLIASLSDGSPSSWDNTDSLYVYNIGAQLGADSSYGGGAGGGADSTAVYGALNQLATDSSLFTQLENVRDKLGKLGLLDRAGADDSTLRVALLQLNEAIGPMGYADTAGIDLYRWLIASIGIDTPNDLHGKVDALSVGAGSGPELCSLWVYDTGNTAFVSGIMVQANNTSGAVQGKARTNVTGYTVLNLTDGDYNLRIPMNSGYIQTTNPQPFTVSGTSGDTVNVTWFSPSAPAGDLCSVYNYLKDANDNGIKGVTITAKVPSNFWGIRYNGQAVRASYSTKTDGNGLWTLPIYPSSLLLTAQGDSASYYLFTDSKNLFGSGGLKVTVPDSATFFMVPDAEQ